MRRLLFAGLVLAASGCLASAAVRQFPWIRARSEKKADPARTRVTYHGITAWSSEGRLHFASDKDPQPAVAHVKSRAAKAPR